MLLSTIYPFYFDLRCEYYTLNTYHNFKDWKSILFSQYFRTHNLLFFSKVCCFWHHFQWTCIHRLLKKTKQNKTNKNKNKKTKKKNKNILLVFLHEHQIHLWIQVPPDQSITDTRHHFSGINYKSGWVTVFKCLSQYWQVPFWIIKRSWGL